MDNDDPDFHTCRYCGKNLTPENEPIGVIPVRVALDPDAANFGTVSACTPCWEQITANDPREPVRLRWTPLPPPPARVFPDRIRERATRPPFHGWPLSVRKDALPSSDPPPRKRTIR